MKKFYTLFLTLLCASFASAQLALGDIAFTGYNADPPDSFSFVTFVDIPPNTVIEFSDNGWQDTGDFRLNEGTALWTSPATVVLAGEQIIVSDITTDAVNIGTFVNSNMNFSNGGDQIFAYDPNNVPTEADQSGFYAAIQADGAWKTSGTIGSQSSYKPSIFNQGFSIFFTVENDNVNFDCANYDGNPITVENLRTLVYDETQFEVGSVTSFTLTDCNFDIDRSTLSVTQNEAAQFSIYPNPANNGFVNIITKSNDAVSVTVFDVLGKQVLTTVLNTETLNISNLKAGIYILKLNQNGATTTKKLVVN